MESEFSTELQSKAFEVLSSDDNTAMETLFSHLFSHQHQSHAITFLQCCMHHHPDLLFIKLFFLLRCSPNLDTRANAARAFRFVKPSELWPKLRPVAQARLKAHFIDYLTEETSIQVLRLASVVLAETVSVVYKTHQNWPEILEWVMSSVASNDDKFREVALLVLSSLPNDCRFLISDALRDRVRVFHSSFLSSLASSNPNVQVASFGAVVSLVRLFSDPSLFHELLRAMMVGVFTLLHGFEGTYFRSAFAELINLVSQEPLLLKPYVSDMVLDVLQIAESEGLSKETHRLAFELVMAMTELKEYREHVLLNLPSDTVVRLFHIPMKMLLSIKEDGVGDHDRDFGIKCLKQLCVTLGGSKVLHLIVYEVLPLYLDDTEWKKRLSGITLLNVIAKEFSDEMVLMENFQGEVLNKVLKTFQDSHVQVRLAAFNFMEMPTNFVQAAQILYHHRLVHAFSIALDSDQDCKVKEQAASAMLFFLKNTLPESLTLNKNVDTIMSKLLSMLKGKESAKQRSIALSTFNIVAQRCHEVAPKYCANYLPILLEACNDKDSEIKEEAARGIRICAEFGTPQLKPFVNRILSEISVLMKDPNRSLSENAKAHDIAVSALGRICEFHRDSIDGSKIVPAWLSYLPLKDDLTEAKVMHEQLCVMVARLDKDLLGAGNQNLVKIIAVFVEVIDKGDKLATTQTIKQMNNLLRQLGRQIPRSALDTILLSLNANQRQLLLPLVSS
ncbi:importin subunit beta-3-like [Gastrolobium bilobum]|uniref:importin subunit beta-3-like n=1 Tax=Gastrolobium bilobum TaxID=150636 RepID=UPI002AB2E9FA|nr:importin subunit beta-3-like [Gastrolobium bilobum]